MIKTNEAHEADICVSASLSGFWVRGKANGEQVNVTLSSVPVVRGFLITLEKLCGKSLVVFDMSERVLK